MHGYITSLINKMQNEMRKYDLFNVAQIKNNF